MLCFSLWLKAGSRGQSIKRKPRRTQLEVESLEQRTLLSAPAINSPGFVSGVVFYDTNANGVQNAGEPGLPGVPVSLSGSSAHLTVNTDSAGRFSFRSVLPGTYTLQAGPVAALLNNHATLQKTITVTAAADLNGNALGFTTGMPWYSPGLLNKLPHGPIGPPADRPPVISHALGTISLPQNATGKVIDLAGFFTDPDYTNSQVRFNLSVNGTPASLTLNLFDAKAPQTVANFFDYINSGAYNNVFFNRRTNPAPTSSGGDGIGVLQGGAVNIDSTGTHIGMAPIGPAITNEFGSSNVADTIAMALTGADINSATNQFFFNTVNNASQLDSQKFAVFGRLDPASDAELATLAATPTKNLTSTTLTHNFPNAGFAETPLNNYNGSSATFPGDATQNNYLVIRSVDVLKRDEFLTYSVVSNSNRGLVTASMTNEFLTLNAVPGHTGTARVTLRATDLFGLSVVQTLTVNITAAPAVTAVNITPDQSSPVSSLKANPTSTSVGLTAVTYTYQWLQNGFPINPTTVPSAATQTLSLSSLDVQVGDKFSVKVTPKETSGSITTIGATFTSDPVTIATASPDPITLV